MLKRDYFTKQLIKHRNDRTPCKIIRCCITLESSTDSGKCLSSCQLSQCLPLREKVLFQTISGAQLASDRHMHSFCKTAQESVSLRVHISLVFVCGRTIRHSSKVHTVTPGETLYSVIFQLVYSGDFTLYVGVFSPDLFKFMKENIVLTPK